MHGGEEGARPSDEPRTRSRRRRSPLRLSLIILGGGLAAMVGAVAIVWAITPIPDTTQELATAQGSVIYYRSAKNVLAKQGVNRKNVPLGQVPLIARDAVIAAENRTFYEDTGVSLSGTMRAMWSTITGRQLQGGSTITQQLVRNYYSGLSKERSITRKLKEIMISLKVDRSKSKDWVLEHYLNTIYFGRGAYGIEAASLAYFNTDVQNLTVSQAAYLAAVIQQPTRFANPAGADLAAAQVRWQSVLEGMVQTKTLTRREAAEQTFPKLAKLKAPLTLGGQKGYMLAQVRAELNSLGYSDEDINQGGLKITTTFNRKLMDLAEESVKAVVPDNASKKIRTGLAAVDPSTGEVLAFYGGRYESNQYDNAFSAKVQAGSTFKPYTLAAALEDGYTLGTRVNGNSPMRVASSTIPNSGDRSYGSAIDLVQATRNSVNTAFVDLGQKVGLKKVAAAAEAAGIPADQLAAHRSAATFPLGVASVSAVQQASGFATFAAGGVHHAAHVIKSITDAKGQTQVIDATGRRAFSPETAADTTYALQQVVRAGTGTAARLYDRPVAGKTGTTDESAAIWFAGYVPQLSVTVNMFRDDNKPVTVPGYGMLYGGSLPAEIWRYFVSRAMDGKPVKDFPEPSSYYDYYSYYYSRRDRGAGAQVTAPGSATPASPSPEPSSGGETTPGLLPDRSDGGTARVGPTPDPTPGR